MDEKGASGFLKMTALLVCLGFLFSGALSAVSDGPGPENDGDGPVYAKENTGGGTPDDMAPVDAGGGEDTWWGGPNPRGNDIFVPGSYWTIGEALAASDPYDRILVSEPLLWDHYTEDVLVIEHPLLIEGEGWDTVEIQGDGDNEWVFDVRNGSVNITGFTLTPDGNGTRVQNGQWINITDCVIAAPVDRGICVQNCSDVLLAGCNITGSEWAVEANGSAGVVIADNNITDQRNGVVVTNSSNVTVIGNRIAESTIGGIPFCTGKGVWMGVNTSETQIVDNAIWDCENYGVLVDGGGGGNASNVTVRDNTVRDCGRAGVKVANGSSFIYILGNTIEGPADGGGPLEGSEGVHAEMSVGAFIGAYPDEGRSDGVALDGNTIMGAERGVAVCGGSDVTMVGDNSITDCLTGVSVTGVGTPEYPSGHGAPFSAAVGYNDIQRCGEGGVLISDSHWVIVFDNGITNNTGLGVELANSTACNLSSNVIQHTGGEGVGIHIHNGSDSNSIRDNDVRFNLDSGMILNGNSNNTVEDNHVNANGLEPSGWMGMDGNGIALLDEEGTRLQRNHVSNPVNNVYDIYLGGVIDPNTWYNNYYGDYTGIDTDEDMIGEKNHTIPGWNWAVNASINDTAPGTKIIVTDPAGGGQGANLSTMMISTAVGDVGVPDPEVGANDPGAGLVGHWKLDEDSWDGTAGEVEDSSPEGNHGTRVGDADTSALARHGRAGAFDGDGDYIVVPDDPSLDLTGDLTVEAWIKTTDESKIIYAKYKGVANWDGYGFAVGIGGTLGKLTFWSSGDQTWYGSTGAYIADGSWHHVAVTLEGATLSFWVDGQLDFQTGPISPPVTSAGFNCFIGRSPSGGGSDLTGHLDDLRVYNTALQEEVIASHAYWPDPGGLVGHWTMDGDSWDGTEGEVVDSSLCNNHGTAMNGLDTVAPAMYGRSAHFDGSDDHIAVGCAMPDMTNLTIAAWVNYMGGSSEGIIFMDGNSSGGNDLLFGMTDSEIRVRADKDGADLNYEGSAAVSGLSLGNAWHHLAWTMAPEESRFYVDGTLVGTTAETASNVGYHAENPAIGRWWDEGGHHDYFDGVMDDLRIYDKVLNPAEIRAAMQVPTVIEVPGGVDGYYYETVTVTDRQDLTIQGIPGGSSGSRGDPTDLPNVTCHYNDSQATPFHVVESSNITIDTIFTYGGRWGFSFKDAVEPNLWECVACRAGMEVGTVGTGGALFNETENAHISGNELIENSGVGLRLTNSTGASVSENHLSRNGAGYLGSRGRAGWPDSEYYWGSGLVITGCDELVIMGNDMEANYGNGMLVVESNGVETADNVVVDHNGLSEWGVAIAYVGTNDSLVENNTVLRNGYGICVEQGSDRVDVRDNNVSYSDYDGMWVTNSMVFNICDNVLVENEGYGIFYDLMEESGEYRGTRYTNPLRPELAFQLPEPVNIMGNTVLGDHGGETDMDGIYVANVGSQTAHAGTGMWHSGTGEEYVAQMSREVDLTGVTDPFLSFNQFYDLADENDYLFINVSDDIDPPRFYKWNIYTAQGGNTSYDWEKVVLDLADFAGETIWLRFQYVTDLFSGPGTPGAGWWLDDIQISNATGETVLLYDDVEGGGNESWVRGSWDDVDRSLIIEGNVIQGTEWAVDLEHNGATWFNDNNVSYNHWAFHMYDDEGFVTELEFNGNHLDHCAGGEGYEIVLAEMENGHPMRLDIQDNSMLHNFDDVLKIDSINCELQISNISRNIISHNIRPEGFDGAKLREHVGDAIDLRAPTIYVGSIDGNEFHHGGEGFRFETHDEEGYEEWTHIDLFFNNTITNSWRYAYGRGDSRGPKGSSCYTEEAVEIDGYRNVLFVGEMYGNHVERTGGVSIALRNGEGGGRSAPGPGNHTESYLYLRNNTLVDNGGFYDGERWTEGDNLRIDVEDHYAELIFEDNDFNHGYDGLDIGFNGDGYGDIEVRDNEMNHNGDDGFELTNHNSGGPVAGAIERNWMCYNGDEASSHGQEVGLYVHVLNAQLEIRNNDVNYNDGCGLLIDTGDHSSDILVEANRINHNTGYWDTRRGDWGNKAGGVYMKNARDVTMKDNTATYNNGSNVAISNCERIEVTGGTLGYAAPFVSVESGGRGAEVFDDGIGLVLSDIKYVTIGSVTIEDNADHGIWTEGSEDFLLSANYIRNNGNHGIYVHDSETYTVSGNTIENNDGSGYYEKRCYDWIRLEGNVIRSNGGDGIHVHQSWWEQMWMTDNTVNSNGGDGIYVRYEEYDRRGGNHHGEWYDAELWLNNSEMKNNDGWGVLLDDREDELFTLWTVDDDSTVVNNDVFLGDGDIRVMADGTLNTNNARVFFRPGFGVNVYGGGTLTSYDTVWTHSAWMNATWSDSGYWYLELNGSATFSDCAINYLETLNCYEAQLVSLTRTNLSMTETHGMTVQDCPDVQLDFTHVRDVGGDGVCMRGSSMAVDSSQFYRCHDGINAEASTLDMYGQSRLFDNTGSGDGLDLMQMIHVSIEGAYIYDNENHGIRVKESAPTVMNCTIFGNGGDGIFLTTCGDEELRVVTSENLIYGNDAGITATKSSYLDSDDDNLTGNDDGFNILDHSRAMVDDGHLSNAILDLFVTDGSHAVVTNTPHDEARATVQNTGSGTGTKLEVRWYIWIAVYDEGAPVAGANITLNTTSPYAPIPDILTTGEDGMTEAFTVWGYVTTFTSRDTSMNPHDIEAAIRRDGDIVYETDQFTADRSKIVVLGVNLAPEAVGKLPDRRFAEGGVYDNAADLNKYFFDREELFFNYTGDGNVLADIGNDGMVTLHTADENWHGTDTLTFKAADSQGQMAYQAMKVTVEPVNDPPWTENATIVPAKPRTEDKLTLSYEWHDVDVFYGDGDNESGPHVEWYRDGERVEKYSNKLSVPYDATSKGELWYAVITPSDFQGLNGTPAMSANVTIRNSPPTLQAAGLSPTTVYVTSKVIVVPEGWGDPDGDHEGYRYLWQVNRNGVWEDLANQTSSVLPAGLFSKGESLRAKVTPFDGDGAGKPVLSSSATVSNSPPLVTGLEIAPEMPNKTDTLEVIILNTSDADGDKVEAFNYTWYVNGIKVPMYTDSYLPPEPPFTSGDKVHAAVSAFDGESYGPSEVSPEVLIRNTPPTIARVLLSPAEPTEADNITALPQSYSDADGDPAGTPRIAWYVNSLLLSSETGPVLSNDNFKAGDVVFAVAAPYDGEDHGPGVSSPSVKIGVEIQDKDGDGVPDNEDRDIDGDGVLNGNDAFPFDPDETADYDGDGIGDAADTDDDGDGVADDKDDFPRNPLETKDTDDDGIGDNSDNDIDGDGVPNDRDVDPYDDKESDSTEGRAMSRELVFDILLLVVLILFILILLALYVRQRGGGGRRPARANRAGPGAAAGPGAVELTDKELEKMSKCSECGEIVPKDADICTGCGARFDDDELDRDDGPGKDDMDGFGGDEEDGGLDADGEEEEHDPEEEDWND